MTMVMRVMSVMRVTRATRVIWVTTSAGTCQYLKQATRSARLGTRCWESPNLNNFDIKHIASLKEAILEDLEKRGPTTIWTATFPTSKYLIAAIRTKMSLGS